MDAKQQKQQKVDVDYIEININQLLNEIIECLKDNCSTWFSNEHGLQKLIPKALNYVDYNLKRNNNYIFEFESLLKAAQQTQENELLKKTQEQELLQTTQVSPPSPVAAAVEVKEVKKRSKSLKILSRTSETSKKLDVNNEVNNNNTHSESNLNSTNSLSMANLNNELSKLQLPSSMSNYLNDLRQQEAVQLSFSCVEQNIMHIGYLLNIFKRFWSKFTRQDCTTVSFNDHLNIFYLNNADNLSAFSQLDQFLYNIHWKITNKNVNDDTTSNSSFNQELHSILLTPTTNRNLLNINFLLNYYKLISYDFISFKLFIRQLQLTQIAAILCQIIYRILNFYQKSLKSSAGQAAHSQGVKDYFVFPVSQFRPISWSNNHVTLHQNINSTSSVSPTISTRDETSLNNLFIDDLKEFLSLSINRLNNQADVINNVGYFYIVNKSNGLVLEAFEPSNTKPSANNKSKAARFCLTKKEKSRNEQLWYYYAYNGCIANKLVRSGHCMAVSSLNPKSPVCLFPNVRTTNCKWFFNHVDNSITSGLGENLVLDFMTEDEESSDAASTTKRYAVIINKKEPKKTSQKWSIEFQ